MIAFELNCLNYSFLLLLTGAVLTLPQQQNYTTLDFFFPDVLGKAY